MPQVVPEQRLSLQHLAGYDGSDPCKAILLAVRGTVFDVTKGALAAFLSSNLSPECTLPCLAPLRLASPFSPLSSTLWMNERKCVFRKLFL